MAKHNIYFAEDITFVDAPVNQYPIINSDYKIKCEVKGNPTPTVDWYKNEVNIVTQERYIVGEGGLTIKNVRESDDGVYRCTAVVISTGQIKSTEIKVSSVYIQSIRTTTYERSASLLPFYNERHLLDAQIYICTCSRNLYQKILYEILKLLTNTVKK